MYRTLLKPLLDKIIAIVLLVVTSPFFLVTWLLLVIVNRGSVWFVQERPGFKGVPFRLIKFRTMREQLDADGNLMPDEIRLTKVGRIIRRLSLDELPQLLCVLKGEMSIIGPRPLLMEYLPRYDANQARRHEVRPGITGWAQVNGRNALRWPERFALDVWYVDHLSFWVDFKILILTVVHVVSGKGISSPTSVTMEKFRGNS